MYVLRLINETISHSEDPDDIPQKVASHQGIMNTMLTILVSYK